MRQGVKTQFARNLRKNLTEAEVRLWFHLRRKQMLAAHFRRQHPIGPFIADFACIDKNLIIEIDGGQHNSKDDGPRDAWFQQHGYRVLRFWNNDVLCRTDDVLAEIVKVINSISHPHPGLPPHAGEGEKP
jgi:primosomal protein N' (replication factor Y)